MPRWPKKNLAEPERTLTVREQESIKESLGINESMLKASSEFGDGDFTPASLPEASINREKLAAQNRHLKGVLERESPKKVSGSEANSLAREKREIEDFLKKEEVIETWQDLGAIRPESSEYKKAVQKALKRTRNPIYERKIARLREINKRLEPDNDTADSLDYLRTDR